MKCALTFFDILQFDWPYDPVQLWSLTARLF